MSEWRPVVGFEGCYRVSDSGEVETLHWRKPRLLIPSINARGYLRVTLMNGRKVRRMFIHRAVMEAFIGPLPPRLEIAHLDNDPKNNCLSNLKYVSRAENHSHKKLFGTNQEGSTHSQSKYTESQVAEIRERKRNGESLPSIARSTGIGFHAIHRLIYAGGWRHV